jgi:hypothetical protein
MTTIFWGLYKKTNSNEELVNKNLLQKMYLANHPNVPPFI